MILATENLIFKIKNNGVLDNILTEKISHDLR